MLHYRKIDWAIAILVILLMIVMAFTVLVTNAHAAGPYMDVPEPAGWDDLMAKTTAIRYTLACICVIGVLGVIGYAFTSGPEKRAERKAEEARGLVAGEHVRRPAGNVTNTKATENKDWVPSAFETWADEHVK